jgi:hypothetical protein
MDGWSVTTHRWSDNGTLPLLALSLSGRKLMSALVVDISEADLKESELSSLYELKASRQVDNHVNFSMYIFISISFIRFCYFCVSYKLQYKELHNKFGMLVGNIIGDVPNYFHNILKLMNMIFQKKKLELGSQKHFPKPCVIQCCMDTWFKWWDCRCLLLVSSKILPHLN